MKFNQNIRLTPPQMLKILKLARTSNILWNPIRAHDEAEVTPHNCCAQFGAFSGPFYLRFITDGLHPCRALFNANFAMCVVRRKLCHVRCSTQTLPCAFFNANFAMCVVQRKLRHVRFSTQTLPCAFLNAKFASAGYPRSITRAQPLQAPWRTGGSYDWASINL